MAAVEMARSVDYGEGNERVSEYKEILTSPGAGDYILVPAGVNQIAACLSFTAGSGRLETTVSKKADVIADTAIWVAWPHGDVSVDTQDVCSPVAAIRQVNVSGISKMELRAQ